jgi:hypothetical protein
MDNNSILGIVGFALSIAGGILAVINHKRIRSKCLSNKELVISLDVENTSPVEPKTPKPKVLSSLPTLPESEEENNNKNITINIP